MKASRKTLAPLLAALFLSCAFFAPRAQAVPIQGYIDFGGVVTFDTMSLATATQVDLWNSSFVLQRTLDFTATTNPGDPVTMSVPWIFNPSTPLPSLWMVGNFTFDLTSSLILNQSPTFLNVRSTGFLSGNGFDTTPAIWTFSVSQSDGGNSNTFVFQSSTVAVPEAGSIVLLGVGGFLLGAVFFARRKAVTGRV